MYPIFIIGVPRTGSTFLYQILTNIYDILYINNYICKNNNYLYNSFIKSYEIYGNLPHNNYLSNCGNTMKYGDLSPSECGALWYNWFSKENNIPINKENMRTEISLVINNFQKPIIFKNLYTHQRIKTILECFPDSKFIHIKRNFESVIQSVFTEWKESKEWWGIKPLNWKKLIKLPLKERIVNQILTLESEIAECKKQIPKNNFITIDYENLNQRLIDNIGHKFKLEKKNINVINPVFNIYYERVVDVELEEIIKNDKQRQI